MTDYGEEIINRLHNTSSLQDPNNPMRKLIDYGIGGWLDNFDESSLPEQVFLESATGQWLDIHGRQFNILRKVDETDDDYRQRIVYESLGHITATFLSTVYDLLLYCYIEDFDVADNTLTSDNVYACNRYMAFVDDSIQSILEKNYVIGTGLTYIEEEQ